MKRLFFSEIFQTCKNYKFNMTSGLSSLSAMRTNYGTSGKTLDITNLPSRDPFIFFKNWFEIASKTDSIGEPNAMMLATSSRDGKPSSRVVLLKGITDDGFQWFTNYESRKGQELKENPHAALLFYWCNVKDKEEGNRWNRQVRIEGEVEKVSPKESTEYFISRPKYSQIGAAASAQSSVIPNRKVFDDALKELEEKYQDQDYLPRPDNWGGFMLRPHRFEFWQGGSNRLHDRFIFRRQNGNESINPDFTHKGENGWLIERLSP